MAGSSGHQDIARRYATAFFALASEQSQLSEASADMAALASAASADDVQSFLNNTTLARSQQAVAVLALAKHLKLSPLTEKLLGTLAQKRRLGALSAVVTEVQALIAAAKGEVTAEVTAAQALDQSQIDQIAAQLKKSLGLDVKIILNIDADIMGGLVIKVGSKLIDSSIRTKLDRLHRALKKSTTASDKAQMKEVA